MRREYVENLRKVLDEITKHIKYVALGGPTIYGTII